MSLEKPKRQLTVDDLQKGSEFTLAQITSVDRGDSGVYNFCVGDIIKVEKVTHNSFSISVNGHLRGKDAIEVSRDEISDFVIEEE